MSIRTNTPDLTERTVRPVPIAAFRNEDDARRCASGLGLLRTRVDATVAEVKGAAVLHGRYPWVISIPRERGEPLVALAYVTGFTDAIGEGVVLR